MNHRRDFSTLIIILFFLTAVGSFAEGRRVIVESGDTLYSIGRKYNVSVEDLIAVNGIVNPRELREGMELTIPGTHVVRHGETLYGIARDRGISVADLCRMNGISENAILRVGQTLRVPEDQTFYSAEVAEAEEKAALEEEEGVADREQLDDNNVEDKGARAVEVSYNGITEGKEISWPHGGPRSSLNGKLKGTQIIGARGDEVVSVNSGEVVWVAPYRGYGTLVMVESMDHHIYAYGGNELSYVEVGQKISAGTVIGRLGINPIEKTAKVFFFVYKNGKPVDPATAPRG
jgi:murein DD-endopeptidase MepM/ murein hydrolase activator NlpD